MPYEVIVVGLGAHGSAAAYQLARRGARVLGLDAFARAHALGSSVGITRVIRLSYFEHPDYVPLLLRTWDLWLELQRDAEEDLLLRTGGIYIGAPGAKTVMGALRSAQRHGLPHELLEPADLLRRFPAFELDPSWVGMREERAGLLWSERCVAAHLRLAQRLDAELHFSEPVRSWRRSGEGVEVRTDAGTYTAAKLVVAAGAWNASLLPEIARHLEVERVPLFWFEPRSNLERFRPAALPVYLIETDRDGTFYGFPYFDDQGLKVARHHSGVLADPDTIDRTASADDEERVRGFLRARLPLADGRLRGSKVCMYTNTPDEHFLLGAYPGSPEVVYASACSGHGFKFSAVIGEILADLALGGATRHPIGFLSAARFTDVVGQPRRASLR